MDLDSELLVAYLQSRPPHAFVPWISPQFEADRPWSTHSVDVRTVDADAPGQRWAWTIVGPDDVDELEPEELWCFVWPHDLDVVEVWESPMPPRVRQQFVLQVPLPRDENIGAGNLSDAEHGALTVAGWTPDAVSAALRWWARMHAGRGDVHFFWDEIEDPLAPPRTSRRDVLVADDVDGPLLRFLQEAIEGEKDARGILRRILDEF